MAVKMTSRYAATTGVGYRPKSRRGTSPTRPYGTTGSRVVNASIVALHLRTWAIEDDCISFDDGVLIYNRVVKGFQVIDWNGVYYKPGTTPRKAVLNFDRGRRV